MNLPCNGVVKKSILRPRKSTFPVTATGGGEWCHKATKNEEETLLENKSSDFRSFSKTPTKVKEVKIKITKKQLEELLGKVDVQGLSVQQVLAQLMSVSDRYESHQRSWRPALKSIPEVN
ncbi:hypothetical protein L1049_001187 [Liquidambar formosana]|uniref:Uncharacterized protein n=1 Tax=Liquidambar formosana TaxID=63359 RepID=A0AAP0R606_LIQFO